VSWDDLEWPVGGSKKPPDDQWKSVSEVAEMRGISKPKAQQVLSDMLKAKKLERETYTQRDGGKACYHYRPKG